MDAGIPRTGWQTMSMVDTSTAQERWRELHAAFARQLQSSLHLRESSGTPAPARPDERLVQAVWADRMYRAEELTTASGKHVEVLEPGRWNTGRGPDFLGARLRVAGETLHGDVEIHVDSSGWTRHGHHQDFEYNRVVLHAVLEAGDDRPYEEKQNGERLERLVLRPHLEPDLETIRQTVNVSDYPYGRPEDLGLCHEEFLRLPEEQLTEFLTLSGTARLEQKLARLRAQRRSAPFAQLIHQALLTGQGFRSSKTLYFLLSKRVPFEELLSHMKDVPAGERVDLCFAALVYTARLVPEQRDIVDEAAPCEETAAFMARLKRHWRRLRPYFSDRLLPPTKRWYAGMRPAGFPTRRLAAVAVLLGRLADPDRPLFTRLAAQVRESKPSSLGAKELRAFWKKLAEPLIVAGEDHYFGSRFTFGGKKGRQTALLGEPAARSLLFNTFLPLLVLQAEEDKDRRLANNAWDAMRCFPVLERNSVSRFMDRRLFGEAGAPRGLDKRELYQQALLKVFADCCAHNERSCSDCTFLSLSCWGAG